MAVQLPGYPSQDTESEDMPIEIHYSRSQWYFSRQELEYYSPSRKDGVDFMTESGLRKLYCSFIQELGMELRVAATQTRPLMTVFVCKGLGLFLKVENTKRLIFMVTIAASMMLCHRFYMRQSHAKNDWQTVATVCIFLACKTEDTPSRLCDVTVVSYKLMYKWDPSAPERIKQKDVYDKQKQLILMGERIVLTTIAYDMNIELPYKPLVAALKRLEISNKDLWTVAWNFVNDWLRTSLCLQYKPHYIAVGSMFLATEDLKIKLPTDMGKVWYMQFDVAPRQLEEVIQDMCRYLDKKRKRATPLVPAKPVESKPLARKSTPNNFPQSITKCSSNINQQTVETSNSTQSCVLNGSNHVGPGSTMGDQKLDRSAPSNNSDCGSASSTVEDGDGEPKPGDSHTVIEVRNSKIDVKKIREAMKRRREGKTVDKEMVKATNDELGSEAWIEMELENGIELD